MAAQARFSYCYGLGLLKKIRIRDCQTLEFSLVKNLNLILIFLDNSIKGKIKILLTKTCLKQITANDSLSSYKISKQKTNFYLKIVSCSNLAQFLHKCNIFFYCMDSKPTNSLDQNRFSAILKSYSIVLQTTSLEY